MAQRDLGACYACPDGHKQAARHLHHVLPLELGGPRDGKTVPLCPSHHTEVHDLARALLQGQRVQANNSTVQMLAGYIVRQQRIFVDSGSVAAEARNSIQVSFSNEEKTIAHDLKRQMGMRSLERMIKSLIIQEWERRQR